MTEDCIAPASGVAIVAILADIWSVQVTGHAWSQSTTGGGAVCQEEEGRLKVDSEAGPCGRIRASTADDVCVSALTR